MGFLAEYYMKRIQFNLNIKGENSEVVRKQVFAVDDDITETEIENNLDDWADKYIELYWEIVE